MVWCNLKRKEDGDMAMLTFNFLNIFHICTEVFNLLACCLPNCNRKLLDVRFSEPLLRSPQPTFSAAVETNFSRNTESILWQAQISVTSFSLLTRGPLRVPALYTLVYLAEKHIVIVKYGRPCTVQWLHIDETGASPCSQATPS